MITRIVKMTFREEEILNFKSVFDSVKDKIQDFEGCHGVQLLQDRENKAIFFTYSIWENEEALNAYRKSEFFGSTWKKTKALFSEKPQAWSLDKHTEK